MRFDSQWIESPIGSPAGVLYAGGVNQILTDEGADLPVGDQLERMKAIIAQAIAEARNDQGGGLAKVHLIVYGNVEEEKVRRLFEEASQGTQAEGVALSIQKAPSRFICWNCCGLRFESTDGVCPNCGEAALEVPDEISFALRQVEVTS